MDVIRIKHIMNALMILSFIIFGGLAAIIMITDTSLAEYYDKLELVVSGDLLDLDRLKTAINMNLGRYDYLIDEYVQHAEE